jgi:MoxR-like ATPase
VLARALSPLKEMIQRAVVGREREIDALLAAFFSGGHVILEGPPGTAKTLLVRSLAVAVGCDFRRIQFTPDLMPADVTGTNVFDAQRSEFRLVRGPVFTDVVLADEINRAPAKTQAALLESMEERQVTIDGVTHALPEVFTLFATMNPIEFEGTYPLPEAQLDRFAMKVTVGPLEEAAEQEVIARYARGIDPWSLAARGLSAVLDAGQVLAIRAQVAQIAVETEVQHYLVALVRRTRMHPAIAWGASTRAAVVWLAAARARAAGENRAFVIPDDIKFLAPFVLVHRLILTPEAQMEGLTTAQVVAQILDEVAVPRAAAAGAK